MCIKGKIVSCNNREGLDKEDLIKGKDIDGN